MSRRFAFSFRRARASSRAPLQAHAEARVAARADAPERRAARPWALWLGAMLFGGMLGGCSLLPEAQSIALYAPQPQIAQDAAWPQAQWQLLIPRPYADATLDSERILVRPQPGALQVYKGAAWTQSAPDVVHDAMLRGFGDSGRLRGVARRGEGVAAGYELLLDLRRFESDYGGGAAPSARIELGARLVRSADDTIVATRVFAVTTPAQSADIAQVAQAFERGLSDLGSQLIGWTLRAGEDDRAARR